MDEREVARLQLTPSRNLVGRVSLRRVRPRTAEGEASGALRPLEAGADGVERFAETRGDFGLAPPDDDLRRAPSESLLRDAAGDAHATHLARRQHGAKSRERLARRAKSARPYRLADKPPDARAVKMHRGVADRLGRVAVLEADDATATQTHFARGLGQRPAHALDDALQLFERPRGERPHVVGPTLAGKLTLVLRHEERRAPFAREDGERRADDGPVARQHQNVHRQRADERVHARLFKRARDATDSFSVPLHFSTPRLRPRAQAEAAHACGARPAQSAGS